MYDVIIRKYLNGSRVVASFEKFEDADNFLRNYKFAVSSNPRECEVEGGIAKVDRQDR